MAKGRPRVEIDDGKLKKLMRLKPSLEDTAAILECSADTVSRHIRDTHDLTFAEFREQNMAHVRISLVQTALEHAHKGDRVMLIFCLKNLCGWKDRQSHELTGENGGPIELSSNTPPAQVLVVLPPNGRENKK